MNTVEKKYAVALMLVSLICSLIVFWPVVTHINSAMFAREGDGLKNYYSIVYYLQHDSNTRFTGMNYPFGEHLSFADGQPGLALPFKWFCYIFPVFKKNGICLVNSAMLLAIMVAPYFYYRVLLHFRTQPLFAAAGALLITFLSPQFFRIPAHYGLSYPFFFGAVWFLLIKTEEKKSAGTAILNVLLITWLGLLHFYLAAISCFFVGIYAFFTTVGSFKKDGMGLHILRWMTALLPVILLQLFMMLTDNITDRPARPWGFFYAIADFTSVFLPHVNDLLGSEKRRMNEQFAEGFAYIGVVSNLFFLVFAFHLLVLLVTGKIRNITKLFNARHYFFLVAAILLLLFAMNIPFKWNLRFLVDEFPFLRQFRAPGRFAWVFYYVIGVFTVSYCSALYHGIRSAAAKKTITVVLIAAASLWTTECIHRLKDYNRWSHAALQNYMLYAEQDMQTLLSKTGRYANEFQCLLTLPYFHVGSEKFSIENNRSAFYAMKASVQFGLPLMNVMMSRTSLQQSCDAVQLFSDSLIQKNIIHGLADSPLLVLTVQQNLNEQEKLFLNKAILLISDGDFALYEIKPSAMQGNRTIAKEKLWQAKNSFVQHKGYLSSEITSGAVLLFADTGAAIMNGNTGKDFQQYENELYNGMMNYAPGDTINMSLWIKADPLAESLPIIRCIQLDAAGRETGIFEIAAKFSANVYRQQVLASGNFICMENTKRIKIMMYGPGIIFNLLIRKNGEQVYFQSGKSFYFNNIFAE
jgi:hypothetical protein